MSHFIVLDKNTSRLINDQMEKIEMAINGDSVMFTYHDSDSKTPININEIDEQEITQASSIIENMGKDNPIILMVINKIKSFLKQQRSIALYSIDYFNYIPINGPIILISDYPERDRRPYFFRVIKNDEQAAVEREVLESMWLNASYRKKRELIREGIING